MMTTGRAKRAIESLESELASLVKVYEHVGNRMGQIRTEIALIKSKFGLFSEIDAQHKEKYKEHYEKEKVN
jgi:hypothetical protein